MGCLGLGLLVDDTCETRMDEVQMAWLDVNLTEDLALVVYDRAAADVGLDGLEDVRAPGGPSGRQTRIGTEHLERGHEEVSLADGEVGAVTTLPRACGVIGGGVVVPLPFRVGNAPDGLGGQVDPLGAAQTPGAVGLLEALLAIGVVEALADLVEDDVTGIGDARLERHPAVAAMVPAVLPIVLAEARPVARAVVA